MREPSRPLTMTSIAAERANRRGLYTDLNMLFAYPVFSVPVFANLINVPNSLGASGRKIALTSR
jgi:hypothetical protein